MLYNLQWDIDSVEVVWDSWSLLQCAMTVLTQYISCGAPVSSYKPIRIPRPHVSTTFYPSPDFTQTNSSITSAFIQLFSLLISVRLRICSWIITHQQFSATTRMSAHPLHSQYARPSATVYKTTPAKSANHAWGKGGASSLATNKKLGGRGERQF